MYGILIIFGLVLLVTVVLTLFSVFVLKHLIRWFRDFIRNTK